ncbi:MAG: gamma-glutamyl-gamma-aminobutyrate hydrolase family protein, partial [Proteobacteria bacterium]|nr:gamma-glutamyl-gamma-aminobutyrate hydrolase family protein [Pseudomonadota bacterium]
MIVGLPVCIRAESNRSPVHQTPARYAEAVLHGAGATPVLIPPLGPPMLAVLDTLDGLLLTGSPSNVHPRHYAGGESETPDRHDPDRDETTLPLIRAAIDRGIPILAICRGIQELNVALGGTLIQRVHTREGRADHRGKGETPAEFYRPVHAVRVSGSLARIVGAEEIVVNSVHGQAIDRPAPGLIVEATASDGT